MFSVCLFQSLYHVETFSQCPTILVHLCGRTRDWEALGRAESVWWDALTASCTGRRSGWPFGEPRASVPNSPAPHVFPAGRRSSLEDKVLAIFQHPVCIGSRPLGSRGAHPRSALHGPPGPMWRSGLCHAATPHTDLSLTLRSQSVPAASGDGRIPWRGLCRFSAFPAGG